MVEDENWATKRNQCKAPSISRINFAIVETVNPVDLLYTQQSRLEIDLCKNSLVPISNSFISAEFIRYRRLKNIVN